MFLQGKHRQTSHNNVNQLLCMLCPLPRSLLPCTPLGPTSRVITEHWVELLWWHSSFPLAICFTHGSVNMSMLLFFNSHVTPLLPQSSPQISPLRLCLYFCPANRFISIFLKCTLQGGGLWRVPSRAEHKRRTGRTDIGLGLCNDSGRCCWEGWKFRLGQMVEGHGIQGWEISNFIPSQWKDSLQQHSHS